MNSRGLLGCILLVCCLLTAGCWDRRELQERGFVIAVAIDLAEKGKTGGSELETFTQGVGTKPLRLSVQVLKLTPAGRAAESKSEGKTFVVSNTGQFIHEMIRDMLGQTSKGLYFEHIQAILISDAVVKEYSLRQIIDFWRRDAEMRWRTRLYIVPGEARKVLDFQPPTGETGGMFLSNISRHYARDPHIGSVRTDLGFTSQTLDNGGDVLLPRLEYKDKQVKFNGLAVFRQDKFIGYWDEYTIKGVRLARGNIKSGIISFSCPEHPGHGVSFEIFRYNTILTPHVEGDNIYFTLSITIRGNISEVTCQQFHNSYDTAFMEKAEELVAEEIKRNISHSLNISRREGIDTMYFKKYLKAYEPRTWARIQDQWDDIFPTIPLYVDVRVSIQNIGEHN
ncbi:Spore germination protein B3 [Sporomusa carbonis]